MRWGIVVREKAANRLPQLFLFVTKDELHGCYRQARTRGGSAPDFKRQFLSASDYATTGRGGTSNPALSVVARY